MCVRCAGEEKIGQSVLVGPRSNMPYRVLKAVVDMMGRRYTERLYDPISLEDIVGQLGLTELRMDTRDWLTQVGDGERRRMSEFPVPSGSAGQSKDNTPSLWGHIFLQGEQLAAANWQGHPPPLSRHWVWR